MPDFCLPAFRSLRPPARSPDIPSREGSSTFTVQVADSESTPQTATMTYTLPVAANGNLIQDNFLLSGPYAFFFRGFGKAAGAPEFPEILAGAFTADGKGTISAGSSRCSFQQPEAESIVHRRRIQWDRTAAEA